MKDLFTRSFCGSSHGFFFFLTEKTQYVNQEYIIENLRQVKNTKFNYKK